VRAITKLDSNVQAEIAQIIQKVSRTVPESLIEVLTKGRSSKNSAQMPAMVNTAILLSALKTSN
jgi:broad-specificity NMP kinase